MRKNVPVSKKVARILITIVIILVTLVMIMGFSLLSASEFLQTEKWRCAKQ